MILYTHRDPCLDCLCSLYLLESHHGTCKIEFMPESIVRGDIIQHQSCMEIYKAHFKGASPPLERDGNVIYLFGRDYNRERDARRLALVSYCDAALRGCLGNTMTQHNTLKSAILLARTATRVDSRRMWEAFLFLAEKIVQEDIRFLWDGATDALVQSGIIQNLELVSQGG